MNLDALLDGARAAAEAAGEILLRHLGRLREVELKGEVDLVTEADRASEALLVERLGALLPEASILAEEGSGSVRSRDLVWTADPLDGTTNYAHGYPCFSVSVGLEHLGQVVLGVVHDPMRGETFHARRGGGAFLGGEAIRVSAAPSLDQALLLTGFPYDVRTSPRDNLTQFEAFLKRARAVRRDGSAALDLAYLAAGRIDGFWEEKLQPWDVAAGTLLVTEAGGTLSGYRGEPAGIRARNLVATNGRFHEEMIAILGGIEASGTLPPLGPPAATPV